MTTTNDAREPIRAAPLLKDGEIVDRLKQFRLRWQEDGDLTYLGKALTDAVVEIESLRRTNDAPAPAWVSYTKSGGFVAHLTSEDSVARAIADGLEVRPVGAIAPAPGGLVKKLENAAELLAMNEAFGGVQLVIAEAIAALSPAPSGSGVREALEEIVRLTEKESRRAESSIQQRPPLRPVSSASRMHCADLVNQIAASALASLASDTSPRGEAVAWRFRYPLHGGKFTHWEFETDADRIKWLTRAGSEAQGEPLYAHPAPAQVEHAAKFKIGDRVTKTKGSSWTGRVVGTYSTALTPEGYAVESETETGSVQIYPASALTKEPKL